MEKYSPQTVEGKCPFCEIAAGRVNTPGIYWEDQNFMAFLSIFPNTKGFTIVIPKKHYTSDVLSMEDGVLCRFIIVSKKVSKILLRCFKDVGRVGLMMEGTGIDHAHIKLFPMHGTGDLRNGLWRQYLSKVSTYFDVYNGHFSSNDGPRADDSELRELAKELTKLAHSYFE